MNLEFYKIPVVSRLDGVVFFSHGRLCFVVSISYFLTATFIIIFLHLREALLEIRSADFRLSCKTKYFHTTNTVLDISNFISTLQYLNPCPTRCGPVRMWFTYFSDIYSCESYLKNAFVVIVAIYRRF
jgi:hypothetical protein